MPKLQDINWCLLLLFILVILLFFLIEIVDIIFFCNLLFPFWEAFVAFGTVGATFVALIHPIIDERNEMRMRKRMIKDSLINEIILNFDQMSYNSLTRHSFKLYLEQFLPMMRNAQLLNTEAESVLRQLSRLYQAMEGVNRSMQELNEHLWLNVKRDIIKTILHVFWLADKINFETDGEKTMTAINTFVAQPPSVSSASDLAKTLPENFWKLNNFKITNHSISNKNVSLEELASELINAKTGDLKFQEEILDFLIHRQVAILNEKKVQIKTSLDSKMNTLLF